MTIAAVRRVPNSHQSEPNARQMLFLDLHQQGLASRQPLLRYERPCVWKRAGVAGVI
jgi:hypothetical protein